MQYPAPAQLGQRMFDGLTFSINFSSTIHVRGPLTLARLENALARLGRRYPMLVARIHRDEENNFFFTDDDVPPVPVRVVEREADDTWLREVQRELPIIFNFQSGPLYRCVWVRGQDDLHDLVLISEHMTADVRSAVNALRDLLALLADPALELHPVFPKRLKELVSAEILQKVAAFEAALPTDAPPSRPWQPDVAAGPQCILPFSLTEAETAALREQCRANRVTIQSALCAAFLTPFAERQADTPLRCVEIPVDLRPYLTQPHADRFGGYLGLTTIMVNCRAGDSLWDVARDAQAALRAALGPDLFLKPPALYQLMEGSRAGGFFRAYDLSISNLGQLDIPAQCGDLQVESVHTPTFNVNAPNHYVLGVATCSGKLCATYASCEPDAPALAERGWALLKGMMYSPISSETQP